MKTEKYPLTLVTWKLLITFVIELFYLSDGSKVRLESGGENIRDNEYVTYTYTQNRFSLYVTLGKPHTFSELCLYYL